MTNLESHSKNLEFNISTKEAEKIWKKVVDKPGGTLDITYLGGKYVEENEEDNRISADVRLYKKSKKEGYQLYINDINKPQSQIILNLLHKLEDNGLLVKSVGVQASHKSYNQMRDELIKKWDEYLQSKE